MMALSEKIYFPSKYIKIKHDDNYLIMNFDNNKSRRFRQNEYEVFKKIQSLKDDIKKNEIMNLIDNNLEYNKFSLQLIMAGLISLRPFEKSTPEFIESHPLSVYWGVSNDCNFRCKYCYANCGSIIDSKTKSHLSVIEYQTIIDKVKEFGFKELVFTGGEPLLNKDVFNMASYAREKELYCGLLTNGSLIKGYNIDSFKIFNYIKISLDSNKKQINDNLRGNGSYDRIIESIKALKEKEINVDIGTVITKYNKGNLEELITFLHEEFGVKTHTLANHIPIGRGSINDLSCTFDELKECDEIILKTKCKLAQNGLYSIIQDHFFPNGRKVSCGMGM